MRITNVPGKATALYDARRNRQPIEPFTDADPTLGMADGYAVQAELVKLLLADGDSIAYSSRQPHRNRNPGPGRAVILFCATPPSF